MFYTEFTANSGYLFCVPVLEMKKVRIGYSVSDLFRFCSAVKCCFVLMIDAICSMCMPEASGRRTHAPFPGPFRERGRVLCA